MRLVVLSDNGCTPAFVFLLRTLLVSLLLSGALLPGAASAAVYASSEAPGADWQVWDNHPAGATVDILYNDEALGYVASLRGTRTQNAFLLGSTSANNGWNNQTEFFATWRMQVNEAYHLYFRVQTSNGMRWLLYNYANTSTLANSSGSSIHHGLGSSSRNGQWQTFARDLQTDLAAAQPGNTLLAVHGLRFRGSGFITDVRLDNSTIIPANITGPEIASTSEAFTLSSGAVDGSTSTSYEWRNSDGDIVATTADWTHQESQPGKFVYALNQSAGTNLPSIDSITVDVRDASVATIYEDGEDNSSARWRVFDNNPKGASIQVIDDPATGSKVIQLQGATRQNGYINGGFNSASGWNNRFQTVLNWQHRFNENFTIYARLDTLEGVRYLLYDQRSGNRLANSTGKFIRYGLGTVARDGNWHSFSRDLRADLQGAQPGNDVIAVNGFLVRGSGEIDNLSLSVPEEPPPVQVPAIPDNLSPLPASLFEAGSSQLFRWSHVTGATAYDFHFFNQLTGELTFFSDLPAADHCENIACTLEAEITLPTSPAHAWRVRSVNNAGRSGWSRSTFSVVPLLTSAPGLPQAVSPAGSADVFSGSSTLFSWRETDTAASYELRLLDTTGSVVLASAELEAAAVCTNALCSSNLVIAVPAADNYQWQVRAGNRIGWSAWSPRGINVLPVATAVPGTPVNLSPEPGALLSRGTSVSFSWQAEPQAAKYDFYIYDTDGNDIVQQRDLRPETQCNAAVCQLAIDLDLIPAENYLWRVSARNSLGIADFSASLFSVIEPVTNAPPNLLLTSATNDPLKPYLVTLDASASTDDTGIELFAWDFGDGSNPVQGSAEVVTHNYTSGGIYTVTLTATDTQGAQSSLTLPIAVDIDIPPVASFTINGSSEPVSGTVQLSLVLDPSGSTDDRGIIEYHWEFGDGTAPQTTDSADTVQHVYATPGDFTLSLQVTDTSSQIHSVNISVRVFAPGDQPAENQAARFLAQATFGATTESISELTALGYSNWLENQFSLQGPAHLEHVLQYSNGSNREARHEIWWYDAVHGQDQLRQRVAYALSQLFVVSDTGYTLSNAQYGVTHFYDLLRAHAFGNYRDLLEAVTLNPVMGIYLSMLQNDKGYTSAGTRPDENFAREVLQLFSVGLHRLNLDGSVSSPKTPTFSQAVVENFARVFTGWNFKDAGVWNRPLFTGQDLVNPLEPFESHHDDGAKTLLSYGDESGSIPAGLSASEDMRRALDNIANHPNVGPFITRQLIQQLVTSNPTPGYISRVAAVFNSNGAGVRGDLKAVVRAILMDNEARNGQMQPGYGKLREPVLKLSHLWRAFNITPGAWSTHGELSTYSPPLSNLDLDTGQAVMRSPSVFNFYSPDYAPAGAIAMNNLVAPEFQIYTDSNILSTTARINSQIQRHYLGTSQPSDLNPAYLDYSEELALAADANTLLDHLDLVLLSGSMGTELRSIVFNHIDAIDAGDAAALHARVRDAITLIMMAPEYQVQR